MPAMGDGRARRTALVPLTGEIADSVEAVVGVVVVVVVTVGTVVFVVVTTGVETAGVFLAAA